MKKLLKSALLIAGLALLLTGCKKEIDDNFEGGLQKVTFSAVMANDVTRAVADNDGNAAYVNRCIMEIYYGDALFTRMYAPVNNKKASFTVDLVSNRTYKVAFWADYVENPATEAGLQVDKYYDTRSADGLKAVALKGSYAGNIDARDAFAYSQDYTVEQGGTAFDVTLKRPFAQINVITTDVATVAKIASLKPEKVALTIKNAVKKYNVLESTAVSGSEGNLVYNANVYNWKADTTACTLSMDYIFAENTKNVIDIDWKATKTGNDAVTHAFSNIPYQRNYRTNIKGKLLTSTGQWNVTVDPIWESPDNEHIVVTATVKDIDGMNTFVANNPDATQYDVQFSQIPNDAGVPTGEASGPHSVLTTPLKDGDVMNISVETNTETLYVGDYENQNSTTLASVTTNAAEVNINVPEGKKITTLIINAPSKSVYLNGQLIASAGTLTNVESTTSQNTLVIQAGQQIGTLTVHQGGLEIHGTVAALVISEDKHDTNPVKVRKSENLSQEVFDVIYKAGDHDYIDRPAYVEKANGTTPETWDIVPSLCQIGNKSYGSLADAYAAAVDGDEIVLLQDQSSERINTGKNITVNLNGHVLTATSSYNVMFGLIDGKKLTINGTTPGSKIFGTVMVSTGKKGDLVVNGGTYENDLYCPFYVNGSCLEGNVWTIKNATIIGTRSANATQNETGFGCYHAGRATTTFLNCTINAVRTGVEVRAGNVTFTNCVVSGETDGAKFSADPNINGGCVVGAAISVSQHNTDYATKVTIRSGGTYSGYYAFYEKDLANETNRDLISMTISSGNFKGLTYSQNCTGFITGGYYSAEPDAAYVEGTWNVIANTDGSTSETYPYTIAKKKLVGSGTQADPFQLSSASDLVLISQYSQISRYYKLTSDIVTTGEEFKVSGQYFGKCLIKYLAGEFDGDGHKITFPEGTDTYMITDGLVQGTIKNLNIEFKEEGMVAARTWNGAAFKNVNVSGKLLHFNGNCGAYVTYGSYDILFEDCNCSVDITGMGGSGDYNAVFVGYAHGGPYTFRNCTYTGKMVCGKSAMFLGNPNSYNLSVNVENCKNAGTIISTYVAPGYKMNYYAAISDMGGSNNYTSFTVNGVSHPGMSNDNSWVPLCWEDPLVTTTGSAINGPEETGMALQRNADKQFVVTPATGGVIGGKTVHHYEVSIGLYVGVEGGSSRQYATETITPDGSASYTTVMKDYKFVDRTYVGSGTIVKVGDNDTYTDGTGTYYVVGEGYTTGGHQPEAATLYSLSAFDENGILLATANLTE